MKFFVDFYKSIYSSPSIKYRFNIFTLRSMISYRLQHILNPHFFLPTKTLKIKNLTSNLIDVLYFFIIYLCFLLILFSFFFG